MWWPKPLLADCEEGRMSVADRAIPYAAIKSSADMKALLDLVEAESKRPKDQRRFETLIIDTLDAYQRIVMQEYLTQMKKSQMSGWQDWGYLDAQMTELVARLSGVAMNVVCNLHVKDTKVGGSDDGDGGILVHSPKLKGDLKDQIASEFDLVGFMETGWAAVNGKRTLARYVQWEPTPDKPILKDRSGQLPARTPVDFSTEDYEGLLRPLVAAQEHLKASTVVEQVEQPEPITPVAVAKGGPMGQPAKSVPGSGTPKKAAAPKKTAAPRQSVAPVPAATTGKAPATKPTIQEQITRTEPEAPVTEEQAVTTVEEVLGAKTIEVEQELLSDEGATTPVSEPEPSSIPDEPADIPVNGTHITTCGEPRYKGSQVPENIKFCGRKLVLDMQEGRVTGCSEPEGNMADIIQIAGMKTRAFMCNGCYSSYRKDALANRK